ncbi:MAG: single-stranded DNA-binding protein [Chloroflexi bacterium]|nr:single-stranded DNA-binding protein [Chloroflexota bacterium]
MVGLNRIQVIGNVGTDPEMRYTPAGNPVTNFSIATNRNYTTSQGERREETEWFRVVTWNKLAETCNQFLAKGQRAYVEGRLRSSVWEGQDGQKRFRNEIVANTVIFLDRPGQAPEEEASRPVGTAAEAKGEVEPDDLPF